MFDFDSPTHPVLSRLLRRIKAQRGKLALIETISGKRGWFLQQWARTSANADNDRVGALKLVNHKVEGVYKMDTAYPDNWQFRANFYGAKWEAYKKRSPNRWPTKRTVRRWVRECNNQIQKEEKC